VKKLTVDRVIWRILNDNRMGIRITSDALAKMLSRRSGKRVWPYYITRWKRGKISCLYRKLLMEVYDELCDSPVE
jgi:hypothetical protein